MTTKGKGQEVNRTGLSDVFGVALNTIDSYVRQGCPYVQRGGGRGQEWKFNTADVARWLQDKRVREATGKTEADENELKLRKLAAETAKAELELLKATEEVAPVIEFERAQAKAFAAIRANMMNIPARAVLRLLGCTDETEFKKVLREEITLALETAAAEDLNLDDDDSVNDE